MKKPDRGRGVDRAPETEAAAPAPAVKGVRSPGLGAAFRRIVVPLAAALRRGAGEGSLDDPEVTHRQRVTIRRLRSVLELFGPCLDRAAARRFDGRLRDLALVWGDARDWDMACLKSFPAALAEAPGEVAASVLDAAEAERGEAHRRLDAFRAGSAQPTLAAELAAWASRGSCMKEGLARTKLAAAAPELLRRLEKRVMRRGRGIEDRSIGELHALRKALKRLNYGVEALASVYPAAQADGFHEACTDLLDRLGRLNDATMARKLARRIEAQAVPAKRFSRRFVRPWAKQRIRKAKRRLPAAWRAFRTAPRPWD